LVVGECWLSTANIRSAGHAFSNRWAHYDFYEKSSSNTNTAGTLAGGHSDEGGSKGTAHKIAFAMFAGGTVLLFAVGFAVAAVKQKYATNADANAYLANNNTDNNNNAARISPEGGGWGGAHGGGGRLVPEYDGHPLSTPPMPPPPPKYQLTPPAPLPPAASGGGVGGAVTSATAASRASSSSSGARGNIPHQEAPPGYLEVGPGGRRFSPAV
jgi:hypothetical protein